VARVRAGADVLAAIDETSPDLVILDMQIGNMGGMAACMSIRHEETADRIPITAVLMLLDREADVFLAKRCEADGWLIKPLDAFRLRKATQVLLDGYSYVEGVPDDEAEALTTDA
jgi:DNA-binding response OmpR family regulator